MKKHVTLLIILASISSFASRELLIGVKDSKKSTVLKEYSLKSTVFDEMNESILKQGQENAYLRLKARCDILYSGIISDPQLDGTDSLGTLSNVYDVIKAICNH